MSRHAAVAAVRPAGLAGIRSRVNALPLWLVVTVAAVVVLGDSVQIVAAVVR